MDRETKYKKTFDLKATVLSIIILIIMLIIFLYLFIKIKHASINEPLKFLFLFGIGLLIVLLLVGVLGIVIGIIKGKLEIAKKENSIRKSNPYIYYRELPNNYGIGVATLLMDSSIENYKDIVAVILDLCARKYLRLIKKDEKYIVKVLKGMDENLLTNEKYVLNLIISNDIKRINYHEWFNYCMKDGIDLGLYYHVEPKKDFKPNLVQKTFIHRNNVHLLCSIVIAILVFIIYIFKQNILISLGNAIFWFILSYMVLIIPFHLLNVISSIKNMHKQISDENYQNVMVNHLTKTQKGIEELHKLYSLKNFIKDFGYFVDKKPEEVIIWDRYLSYAQVFGLTKEIMFSGYKELVDNSSFQIDNIENITLNNIEIDSKFL